MCIGFMAETRDSSLFHSVYFDSGVDIASYTMDTKGYFPSIKLLALEVQQSSPTNMGQECMELYSTSPCTFML
jgi:hypothetical protein